MTNDGYFRWLSRFFFASGMDSDDLYQEARLAAWLAPEHPRLAARRQILDLVKIANRRSFDSVPDRLATVPDRTADVVDLVEARERLRAIFDLPPNEQRAIGRVIRGEPIRRSEKALQSSLVRARRRLAA